MKRLAIVESCATCAVGQASGDAACQFHEVSRPTGSLLLPQGQVPTAAWFLRRGSVLLSSSTANGEETECALRGPGTMLGLETLRNTPSPYEAWALTDVLLCRLDSASFRTWLGPLNRPAALIAIKALEEGEQQRHERVVLTGRVEQRVARFLLERARAALDPLPIEQQLLARMLGMKPETMSRALAALRRSGALAPGRGIKVASLERLAAAADPPTRKTRGRTGAR